MANRFIVVATILIEGSYLMTELIGTADYAAGAFKLLDNYDYLKVIEEELDSLPEENVSETCAKEIGTDKRNKVIYNECRRIYDWNGEAKHEEVASVMLYIFED